MSFIFLCRALFLVKIFLILVQLFKQKFICPLWEKWYCSLNTDDLISYETWPLWSARSSHREVFFEKCVLKICSKFTGEDPYRSLISIKLLCSFIEITLPHECSPVNLLHIFRTPCFSNTSGWLLLKCLRFTLKQFLQFLFSSIFSTKRASELSIFH